MTTLRLALPFGKYLRAQHFGRAGFIVAGIVTALLFFFVGAFLRLLVGPVSIGPFSGTLQAAIDQALPGVTVKYDQAAVEWSHEEGRVSLVVLGARVFDADGRIIAQAPKADIDLAAAPLLLRGRVEVRQITLVGVELTMVHTKAGGLRLGVEKDSGETDFLDSLTDTLTATNTSNSSLQRFAVRDARMAFFDEVTGLFVVAPRADLKIETAGQNLEATLNADIEISGHPSRIAASLMLPPKKGPVSGTVAVTGLDVSALGANTQSFAALKTIALTSDFSASFTIDEGSRLAAADFGVDAHGHVRVPGLIEKPFTIRAMHVLGRYDGNANRLLIEDGKLDSQNASAHLIGQFGFNYDINNELSRVDWDSTADSVHFNDPSFLAAPVSLDRIGFRGNYALATNDITIDHLGLSGGLDADVSGKISLVPGQSPAMELTGKIGMLAVRDMVKFWPLTIGAGARDWVSGNIFAGSVGPIAFQTHFPAGIMSQPALPDGALLMTFPITGVEINYIQGLTHLTQVNANAKLTGDNFAADISSGRVGPIAMTNGRAVIANLHVPGAPGDITAHLTGSMPDILQLIDQKPLNYPTRFGIDAQGTKGNAAVDIAVRVPMLKNVSVDNIGISVKAKVTDFDIALGASHTRLNDGTVDFAVDNNKLSADGLVSLAGSRLAVNWREDFKGAGATTHVTARGPMGEAAREALGLHLSDFLSGPMTVDAVLTGRRGQFTHADMSADLTQTSLTSELIGIHKPPGIAATAKVAVEFAKGAAIKTVDAHIAGPDTTIVATAGFTPTGSLASLNMPTVRVGNVDDFSLVYTRSAAGENVLVRGRSVDGSNIASRGASSVNPGAGAGPSETVFEGPFHIDAKVDRLVLRDGIAMAPFTLDVSGIGNRPASLNVSGSLSKSAQVSGSIVQGATARRLGFTTNDLGLLAHGLFGFAGLHGGTLDVSATLPGRATDPEPRAPGIPDYEGTIVVKQVRLTDQPFLARLFTAASIIGFADLLSGQGIYLDKAEIPFSSRNGVISIHDAIASGPTIGATADGYIDRPKDVIAIKGTLAPAVGININSVIGAIPLVGNLLVSKKGEGILGVTYSVKGNADQPDVSVNPLAMLTPGILRRIFQGRMPTAEQAPSNNVQAASPPPAAVVAPLVPPQPAPSAPPAPRTH